jgi:hypothetical protein
MEEIQTNQFRFYYSGSKADFLAAGRDEVADENGLIVFIKDSANAGKGACIYAQGMFFADFSSLISALAYVKGIKIGTQLYNAAQGGGYIAFEAADPATIQLNASSNGIKVGLTEAFVEKVNDVVAQSATIFGDYLKSSDYSSLQGLIGTAKAEAISTVVGKSGDASSANTIYGAKKYADEKVAGLGVTTLAGRVSTLEGSDAGKSVRGIVQDELTKQLSADGISDSFDTLQEIAKWLSSHPDDVTSMNNAIAANTAAIQLLNGDGTGSVNKKIADAIAAEVSRANGAYDAKGAAAQALIDAKKYTDDKTAGLSGDAYTKAEVNAMFAWGTLD